MLRLLWLGEIYEVFSNLAPVVTHVFRQRFVTEAIRGGLWFGRALECLNATRGSDHSFESFSILELNRGFTAKKDGVIHLYNYSPHTAVIRLSCGDKSSGHTATPNPFHKVTDVLLPPTLNDTVTTLCDVML